MSALVPGSGPTSAGTVLTLTGTNLSTASAVTFGGTAAPFTVVSDTRITAVAPAGARGRSRCPSRPRAEPAPERPTPGPPPPPSDVPVERRRQLIQPGYSWAPRPRRPEASALA
nr:IPT/TIG domain-containing protein [Streptomyces sp. SID4941]